MRIEIKVPGKSVKDKDIKALYILREGIKTSSDRMLHANLKFILAGIGLDIKPLNSPNHATKK